MAALPLETVTSSGHRFLTAGIIGVALGLMVTFRPLDAVVASFVTGVFQLTVFRTVPKRAIEWAPQILGGTIGIAPLLIANFATTGHPLQFAYGVQWGAAHNLGFHVDPYGQPFTPRMGIEHALTYVGELSMFVTAWPIPSMLLVVTSVWLAAAVPSSRRWDLLLLGHFLLQLSVHAIYWGRGEFLGPRFLFTALPTLIVFIGRLPGTIIARAASIGSLHRRAIPAAVAMAFVGCLVLAWSAPASWLGVQGLMRIAAQSRQALRANVAGAVRAAGIGTSGDRALMFLREPFGARLTRRIWGIGVSRGETARLLAARCMWTPDMVLRLETDPTVPDTSAVSCCRRHRVSFRSRHAEHRWHAETQRPRVAHATMSRRVRCRHQRRLRGIRCGTASRAHRCCRTNRWTGGVRGRPRPPQRAPPGPIRRSSVVSCRQPGGNGDAGAHDALSGTRIQSGACATWPAWQSVSSAVRFRRTQED